MEIFTYSELILVTLTKNIIQNVFDVSSNFKDIRFKQALQHSKTNGSQNVGVASLQKSKLGVKTEYIAFNFVNEPKDIQTHDSNILQKKNLNLCMKDESTIPVQRIKVNKLEFYTPQSLGYAHRKCNCTERKILSRILKDFDNSQYTDQLGGTLYLYSKLEPCIYCFKAMEEFQKKTNTNLIIIYEELIFELIRDNIESKGPRNLVNILYPTEYSTLFSYDPNLATKVKEDIFKRKNIDITNITVVPGLNRY